MTDEPNDVWMEQNFPRSWTPRYFFPAILLGTFAVNSADGRLDGMDGGFTDRCMDVQVESQFD